MTKEKDHPESIRARTAVKTACDTGRLKCPTSCSQCGAAGWLHKHHENYLKPLEVIVLCPRCHKLLHLQRRAVNALPPALVAELTKPVEPETPLSIVPFTPAERLAVMDVYPNGLPPGSLNEQITAELTKENDA
ncbi:MAG: hypothetical protein IMZ57_06905 [Acidobacteria bacterium]|nr:hypothetical protein [Acidobacteriota bacterium]